MKNFFEYTKENNHLGVVCRHHHQDRHIVRFGIYELDLNTPEIPLEIRFFELLDDEKLEMLIKKNVLSNIIPIVGSSNGAVAKSRCYIN